MTCGIYRIYNKIDGKSYIGSSCHIEKRFKEHKAALRKGIHVNKHLQGAWNKYGEDAFEFKVVEVVDRDHLLEEETVHINLVSSEQSYNIVKNAEAPMTGRKHSEETKRKISIAHTNVSKRSEHKENIKLALQKRVIGDGIIFDSTEEAALTMNLSKSAIRQRIVKSSWPTWYYIEKGDGREYDDA